LLTIYGSAGGISGSPRYGLAALIISGLSLLVVLSTRMATPEIMATMLLFGGTALLLANLYTRERSDIRLIVAGFLLGFAFIAGAGEALFIPLVVLVLA